MMVENVSCMETTQLQFFWRNHAENNFLENYEDLGG